MNKPGSGEIVGHVPDTLAEILSHLLSSGEIQCMKCEVTGLSKAAAEGVWVKGGVTVTLNKKLNKIDFRDKLKKWGRKYNTDICKKSQLLR